MTDYYKILGIDEKASEDDIKKSYRKLAMQHHPDKNGDDPESVQKLQEINEAYEHLSDPSKRKQYDARKNGHGGFAFDDLSDFMSQFRQGGPRRPVDMTAVVTLEVSLKVTLGDFIKNKTVKASVNRQRTFGELVLCSACNGHGKVKTSWGGMQMITTCENCAGHGKISESKVETKVFDIPLSYGNYQYVLNGEGNSHGDGTHGAVMITVEPIASDGFSFDEKWNIIHKIKLPLKEFLIGKEVIVDFFGSKYKMRHENNGDALRIYRLSKIGLKTMNKSTDLIIQVTPTLPVNINEEKTETVDQLMTFPGFSE